MEKNAGAYYAVIPADVRYDGELAPNAKLLYGELTSLCGQEGYCWATNDYFAELYGLGVSTISRLVSQLEAKGYIRCETVPTKTGSQRRIYAGIFVVHGKGELLKNEDTPLLKNRKKGLAENEDTPLLKNRKGGLLKNEKQNNININNTPYSPPEGDAYDMMLFERFWCAYPKKKDKRKAWRAWKKLHPDSTLCRVMSEALERDKQSQDWRKESGRFIPYPSTWLNGRRWEDEPDGTQNVDQDGERVLPKEGRWL